MGCYDFIQKYSIFVDVYYFLKKNNENYSNHLTNYNKYQYVNSYCRITLGIIGTLTQKIPVGIIDEPQLNMNVRIIIGLHDRCVKY